MSQASWPTDDGEEHNWLDPVQELPPPPSSNVSDRSSSDSEDDDRVEEAAALSQKIKKLKAQRKIVLTGKQPKASSEKRKKRRAVERQHEEEARVREENGGPRYLCEVDMRGMPCGQHRTNWLACLRGHSQDVDFSIDNYNKHSTTMLLAIKRRVDSTFDYQGGLGYVTEESFHQVLKKMLKTKRYQMKKALLNGTGRPQHIRGDHWVNLSNLIADEGKIKQAEKLKENRAAFKKPSTSDSMAPEVTEQMGSRCDRGSPSTRQSKVAQGKTDMETRIEGVEASLKFILDALKIPAAATAPPPPLERGPSAKPTTPQDVEKVSLVIIVTIG